MYENFKKLLDNAFTMKNISLNIVNTQNIKSLTIRGESNSSKDLQEKFKAPESFDIRLHESLRIMSDWINILENEKLTHKESSTLEI